MEEKDKKGLAELDITANSIEAQKQEVFRLAFEDVNKVNTVERCEWFLAGFKEAPHLNDVIKLRNHLAYLNAEKEGTYQAFKAYMDKYPAAEDLIIATEN